MKTSSLLLWFGLLALLPVAELALPSALHCSEPLRTVFIFTFLALGLHVVTGLTGQLNLGSAAFMAIGAYAYAISTCEIYPFQLGFWGGVLMALLFGALFGWLVAIPTVRLRGDYLAIVTLGFGEITQDVLRNFEGITKGTQGLNPLPGPSIPGLAGSLSSTGWYYFLLLLLLLAVWLCRNLERSIYGLGWSALRLDELAAASLGLKIDRLRARALIFGASLGALAGALYAASLQTSGEPGNYDFQISVLVLCCVIIGGLGSLKGVLAGTLLMVGTNSIVLNKLSTWLAESGLVQSSNVMASPNNWKFMLFGLVLLLMMRLKPDGLFPQARKEH